jgi:uroporphyrinogen decarboxylase
MHETMTPKERWLAVLNRQKPDRVPMDYWATEELTAKLMGHLGCADAWEMYARLHIDKAVIVEPRYVGPPRAPGYDIWGCQHVDMDYGAGVYAECVGHPLAGYTSVEEVEAHYTWPTTDWFDYTVLPEQVKGLEAYPVEGGGSEPFLDYAKMRGMEQAYMDLVEHPELVGYCLDRMFDFCYQNTMRVYEALPGQVQITYVAEDFGSQHGLLISPKTVRQVFIPRMKRIIDLAHSAGAYVIFHSDGAVRPILPAMIAAGIDVLNPIQWRCAGMEREGLKRDFGDQVILHGGVDNQQTLAFGTVEEVREEVRYNLRVLGAGGGYILAPCHNIQAISPVENVVAMYEEGYSGGWGG